MESLTRLARTRSTYIALLIAGVVFFFVGNLGGKQGNPSWLLAPGSPPPDDRPGNHRLRADAAHAVRVAVNPPGRLPGRGTGTGHR